MFCCDTNSFAIITGESKIVSASNYTNVIVANICSSLALTGNLNLSGICKRVLTLTTFGNFYFVGNPSFTGSITGSKYYIGYFGIMNLLGRGVNTIPATNDGILDEYGIIL